MALTANIGTLFEAKVGTIYTFPIGTGIHIYRYALVCVRLTGAGAGMAYPAIEDAADAYKQVFVGFAMEEKSATGDSVRTRKDGRVRLNLPGADSTYVGKLACIKDDCTVQLWTSGSTGKVVVGRIVSLPSLGYVFVDINTWLPRLATTLTD
jgi:hypothetical protein